MNEVIICPRCGYRAPVTANFCKSCGSKLKEVCNCPWLNRPHNCGKEVCPGFDVVIEEMRSKAKLLSGELAAEVDNKLS